MALLTFVKLNSQSIPPGFYTIVCASAPSPNFVFALAFISNGCHNKVLKLGGLSNRSELSHSPGDWKSQIKVLVVLVPSEGYEGQSVPYPSPSFWWFPGSLWYSLVYRSIILISAFIFTWPCPCVPVRLKISPFVRTSVIPD